MLRIRRWGVGLGILCLVVGLFPNYRSTTTTLNDGTVETTTIFSLGLVNSPSMFTRNFESKPGPPLRQPNGSLTYKGPSFQMESKIEFISWSMLLLVMAVIFIDGPRQWQQFRNARSKQVSTTGVE